MKALYYKNLFYIINIHMVTVLLIKKYLKPQIILVNRIPFLYSIYLTNINKKYY